MSGKVSPNHTSGLPGREFRYPDSRIDINTPEHPKKKRKGGKKPVPMYTELFRQTWLMPKVFEHIYRRHAEDDDLKAISGGCSNGAEVDTFLATHRTNDLTGKLAVRGFDNSHRAIQAARAGRYWLPSHHAEDRLQEARETLREYGFFAKDYLVDAAPLRRRQQVSFTEVDLRQGIPGEEQADVVLANSMLHHLSSQDATQVALNLAATVAEKGVFSIGCMGSGHTGQSMPGKERSEAASRYYDWVMSTSDTLSDEFGLQPVEFGVDDQPAIFARD